MSRSAFSNSYKEITKKQVKNQATSDLIKTRKGIFIPDITVEMFRNASLEAVEELLVSGEMQDIIFVHDAEQI